MPYITTEEVKVIRQNLKKQFPKYKFSVRREHSSSVNVDILEAPVNLLINKERGYEQVNHFWIRDTYNDSNPLAVKPLEKINAIISHGKKIIVNDGDYGNIPNFYHHINIGSWNRPFKIVKK